LKRVQAPFPAKGAPGKFFNEWSKVARRQAASTARNYTYLGVIVTVEYRGFTPAGELRHPVIRGWHGS
jgi:hypothetical protein